MNNDNPSHHSPSSATQRDAQHPVAEAFKLIGEILTLLLWHTFYVLVAAYRIVVPADEESVAGEIVLITGTGHGIGRETALLYARAGAVLVCVDVNEKANQDTVRLIEEDGGKAYPFVCDVSNRSAVMDLALAVKRTVGTVSILVNNAGIMPTRPLLEQTEAEIRLCFDINVLGNLWMIQALLPDMIVQQKGHIVAMCSIAGMSGIPNLVPYCSTKFAVRGYMEALLEEMRHTSPIKCTTIYPYMVDTGLCKKPYIRFPTVNPLLTPALVASTIITAQRRGLTNVSIPSYLTGVEAVARLWPIKSRHLLADFLKTGVKAD